MDMHNPSNMESETSDFLNWLEEHSGPQWNRFIKRLAANDTLATDSHQVGAYVPNHIAFELFPNLQTELGNPKRKISTTIDSANEPTRETHLTYYKEGPTRNECRITRWGGNKSPMLDPESTGSVCVMAFSTDSRNDKTECRVWLCTLPEEEALADHIGPVEPSRPFLLKYDGTIVEAARLSPQPCDLKDEEIPSSWKKHFPRAVEIVTKSIELRTLRGAGPDEKLLKRRECEYQIFKCIESFHALPIIKSGFTTIEEFLDFSHKVANRRKSRSGRSLELHVKAIFDEGGTPYSHGSFSEDNKRPDFIFPSAKAYQMGDPGIEMLAVKTTCKDRWRQILNEANKIEKKHLLTLQEGVSKNQFKEMTTEGVKLVIPKGLKEKFPKECREELMTLEEFIHKVTK